MDSSSSSVETYITYIANIFLIVGSVFPYIPQYYDIAKSGDASGFSTLVCFDLLLANSLRIVYWFGHQFDEVLLVQSIFMIMVMFVLLELCIRTEKLVRANRNQPEVKSRFLDFQWLNFWKWTDIFSYVQAMIVITAAAAMILLLGIHFSPLIIEGIGYLALFIESILALPQFYRNLSNRSVLGMNIMMVILWTIGDVFKGVFYVWKEQPLPFILCAAIQVSLDLCIFSQVVLYS